MSDHQNPSVSWEALPPLAPDAPSREDSWIVIAVMIVGALIALPAFLGLIGSASISFTNARSDTAYAVAFDLAYLILGVGLILRRELARQVYVVLAVISLIFVGFATIEVATLNGVRATSGVARVPSEAARTQASIERIQDDRHIAAVQKQRIARELQREVARYRAEVVVAHEAEPDTYKALIPGFLLALIPLVFLTRPSVKNVFN